MIKRALITGIGGQDGVYLNRLLLNLGVEVYGISRVSANKFLSENVYYVNEYNFETLSSIIKNCKPDVIFHLASPSSPSESFKKPEPYRNMNVVATNIILKLCLEFGTKLVFASSSEAFGCSPNDPIAESSIKKPTTPYGLYKKIGSELVEEYRGLGVFCCTAHMYTHISPIKPAHFVSQKIVKQAVEVKKGLREYIHLGYIENRRDWGHASEYVEALYKMAMLDTPEDFILCTNQEKTIREYAEITCEIVGIPFEVVSSSKISNDYDNFVSGDCSKAKKIIGWNPKATVRKMIVELSEFN